MNLQILIERAKELLGGDFENIEYFRGICELIAEAYPKHEVQTGERAIQIAQWLGSSEEEALKMYN